MSRGSEHELARLQQEVTARQYYPRSPKRISETISRLLTRRGYAQIQVDQQRSEAWANAVGKTLAKHSRVGNLRRGVLEVIVRNSSAVQELTFQKRRLVKRMKTALPNIEIRDLRFRVGVID